MDVVVSVLCELGAAADETQLPEAQSPITTTINRATAQENNWLEATTHRQRVDRQWFELARPGTITRGVQAGISRQSRLG
jgi:hypothetical protein